MAGLLGALVAGGVKGYTSQRLEDINEQEKFDFAKSLQDAQFEKEVLLKELGYKHDVELQGIRKQDAFEQADYETNKKVGLAEKEIELKNADAEKERNRIGGLLQGDDPNENIRNLEKSGDLKSTQDYKNIHASSGKNEYQFINDDDGIYAGNKSTGKLERVGGSAGDGSGKGKSSKDKNWNKEMLPVIKEAKDSVLGFDGMSELDPETGKAKPSKNGLVAQGLAERLLKANPDFATQSVAEIASHAVTNPDAMGYKQYKMPDGSIKRVPAINYKGQLYEYSNAAESIVKPSLDKKEAPKQPAKQSPSMQNKDDELFNSKVNELSQGQSKKKGIGEVVQRGRGGLAYRIPAMRGMAETIISIDEAKARGYL